MAKHLDNKADLIKELKLNRAMQENMMGAVFKSYMLLACTTLLEDFEYDEENITAFRDGILTRLKLFDEGKLTVAGMEKELYERVGVYIQDPRVTPWKK